MKCFIIAKINEFIESSIGCSAHSITIIYYHDPTFQSLNFHLENENQMTFFDYEKKKKE